jgi:hypothetical protein
VLRRRLWEWRGRRALPHNPTNPRAAGYHQSPFRVLHQPQSRQGLRPCTSFIHLPPEAQSTIIHPRAPTPQTFIKSLTSNHGAPGVGCEQRGRTLEPPCVLCAWKGRRERVLRLCCGLLLKEDEAATDTQRSTCSKHPSPHSRTPPHLMHTRTGLPTGPVTTFPGSSSSTRPRGASPDQTRNTFSYLVPSPAQSTSYPSSVRRPCSGLRGF